MEQPTVATTILDLPEDIWKLIITNVDRDSLSLTCKHLLSITNNLPFSLTLTPPLLHHLTTLLLPLLRRLSTSLHSLSIESSASVTTTAVDAVFSYIVSTGAAAHLRCLHLSNHDGLPLEGLRYLGSNPNCVKVLKLCNISDLCDELVVEVCVALPLIEEIDLSFYYDGPLTDKGIVCLAQKLKSLRMINISGNLFITDKSLFALSDCCLDLCEVRVWLCSAVTENGIGYVMRHSAKLRWISMTILPQLRLEESGSLFSIEYSIRLYRNLSTLEFYFMDVEDRLLCSIAEANLPLSKFTAFYCGNFTLSGLSGFLRAYPNLEQLDLEGAELLTDEAMKGLVPYLGNLVAINITSCYGLTTLNISHASEELSFTRRDQTGMQQNLETDSSVNHWSSATILSA